MPEQDTLGGMTANPYNPETAAANTAAVQTALDTAAVPDDARARAGAVVAGIAELAAGQAKMSEGYAARVAAEAPEDGDPAPPTGSYNPAVAVTSVVARIRRQGAVVDRLAVFGAKRRQLMEELVNLDAQIVDACQDGAKAGLSWPELHEALGSDMPGPSFLRDVSLPATHRLYARAHSSKPGPHPPVDWQAPVSRKPKTTAT